MSVLTDNKIRSPSKDISYSLDITEIDPFERQNSNTNDQVLDKRPPLEYRPTETDEIAFEHHEPASEDEIESGLEMEEEIGPLSFTNPPGNLHRVITACIWVFTLGCSDGSVGVLLNYIELQYNISYSVSSLLWLSNAVGYILVAALASKIQTHLGRKSTTIGCVFSVIMYSIVSSGSKFPLIVAGFFFGGIGVGICVSQFNVFVSRLEKSSTALGYFHGCYGLGASVSPLIATALVEAGIKWHYYYLILIGLMVFNTGNTYYAFIYKGDELKPWDAEESKEGEQDLMKEAIKNKLTWMTSFFVLVYQGAEVAIGGWVTTYLREYRKHNEASIGYVASGYWFGVTFGRLVLTRLIHKLIGARRGNSILGVLAIIFILLTWLIPSLPIEILTITLSGICIGPIYPLLMTYVVSEGLLPRKIQVVSLTITTAFGSSGGAIFPFIVGLISQFTGTFVVFPSCIALFSAMLVLWLSMPNTRYRNIAKGKLGRFKQVW
ncbi:major facilitator superfamily domain-containing protein [Scheffersomyces coipomensis]|uniref:major facilitator superfamily domain-containing protein n=1 Tax=Scheffersomyces coipomensis TaxID=1788519 RepID=UPI00315D0949